MSSDLKLETGSNLESIACSKSSKSTCRGSRTMASKPAACQVIVTPTVTGAPQSRRYRSYSATLNRPSRVDHVDVDKSSKTSVPFRKLSQPSYGLNAASSYSLGDRLKRRHGSLSAGCVSGFKRRKKEPPGIVPPTKFLLGGNITDPLNLNSFVDEKPGSRQQTPDVSPRLPVPKERSQVEVLIPPNINDPLNLNGCDDDAELESILVTPKSKNRKRKNKNKKQGTTATATATMNTTTITVTGVDAEQIALISDRVQSAKNLPRTPVPPPPLPTPQQPPVVQRCQVDLKVDVVEATSTSTTEPHHQPVKHKKSDNKIVSPVIPQPGSTTTRKRKSSGHTRPSNVRESGLTAAADAAEGSNHVQRSRDGRQQRQRTRGSVADGNADHQDDQRYPFKVTFNPKNARFRYGNYNRYYGYRNPDGVDDYRLQCFKRGWFDGKDVLDVGCNIGHITLSVARDFAPRKVVGVDIDAALVRIARRNVVHYLKAVDHGVDTKFPISLSICCGPIAVTAISNSSDDHHPAFPNNVCFVEGNYVLESDDLLEAQRAEFDTVICLSLTKWVHLNWGDDGLKRLFKRIFRQLRPGGRLILEAQAFASYGKKKKLVEVILHNYQNIKFMPEHFTEYLLSKEVGFSKCEVIDTPFNVSKGFRRPIQLFTKGGNTPTRTSPPSKDDELLP